MTAQLCAAVVNFSAHPPKEPVGYLDFLPEWLRPERQKPRRKRVPRRQVADFFRAWATATVTPNQEKESEKKG